MMSAIFFALSVLALEMRDRMSTAVTKDGKVGSARESVCAKIADNILKEVVRLICACDVLNSP